jgi:hypothetical protein
MRDSPDHPQPIAADFPVQSEMLCSRSAAYWDPQIVQYEKANFRTQFFLLGLGSVADTDQEPITTV